MFPKCIYKDGLYRDDYIVVFSEDEAKLCVGYSDLKDPNQYIYTTEEKKRGRPKKVDNAS
jgi:hypothetical protein